MKKETSNIPNCPALNFNSPHHLGKMYMGAGLDFVINFCKCKYCGAVIEEKIMGRRTTYTVKEEKRE
ncbi:hypothetical protein C6370_20060 [Bacillus atrophaeus]|uniref:hypothetical protein n=1 Tax=Bacillus atrophaeus TaxID=1452 RepID=UPI000D06A670|nr:hypothetical protein [Bacillus atrophaeus]PSA89270.1 hypothetical protein C6370_20060 [Bacillus atrophaeus]